MGHVLRRGRVVQPAQLLLLMPAHLAECILGLCSYKHGMCPLEHKSAYVPVSKLFALVCGFLPAACLHV